MARPARSSGESQGSGESLPSKSVSAKSGPSKSGPAKSKPVHSKRVTPKPTPRYTPPVPKSQKVSPLWVPVLMFTCLGLGMLIILANYVDLLPGDGPNNLYLLIGLGFITAGFITATRYH